ncbi:hypothetical protein Mal4_56310 [Maioricimonas rarisocia]|uniref:Uncharacterized protein n=1 Tax=Maioricimonas rarisocia TaxID=2528026 RepID=A0A517ZFL1_9PLAN|nr:hypothetical protein [Maioricimonas rarisocia]QDU41265.1 hypothetical protein Mal4_56310 [Maioricimonas rarisocia]
MTSGTIAGTGFPVFLTSFDPSDLPSASLDALGFERGYLFLADKILPGLTNVANCPRYFSILCAGTSLASIDSSQPLRQQYRDRLDCLLRFERSWALANVLAFHEEDGEGRPLGGLRGVRYARRAADAILSACKKRVHADFALLSRQVPYGVVGMYGAVANEMRIWDRKTLVLTPSLGEPLARGFLKQSETPASIIRAVRTDGDVPVRTLVDWGRRVHVAGDYYDIERRCLSEALHRDPVRSRMANVLSEFPYENEDQTELERLAAILPELEQQPENRDLFDAVRAILAYEQCYRLALLGFERLLWFCRTVPSAAVDDGTVSGDHVIERVRSDLPDAVRRLTSAMETAESPQFREGLDHIADIRLFLAQAASACTSASGLVDALMARHRDVQYGKFDRGRRKLPWLERPAPGRISLTMTRTGGLDREATGPADITPHPYRLASADALNRATRDA